MPFKFFQFKTVDMEWEVENWVFNAIIVNAIMISLVAWFDWSTIGSWINSSGDYWTEISLFVFAISMVGSFKRLLGFNIIMFLMSVVFCVFIGFILVTIPFSIGIFYVNLKALTGVIRYKSIIYKNKRGGVYLNQ
ncbi:MAG TPA: hypothetical protein VF941_17030 [Clostridia bacterium]